MKKIILFLTAACLITLTQSRADCLGNTNCLPDLSPDCNPDNGDIDQVEQSCYQCDSFGSQQGTVEQFACADDGTPLNWTAYLPSGTGKRTVVIVIWPSEWRGGFRGPACVARDLAQTGFIALTIDHRLDCNGNRLPNQVCLAYSPEYAQNQISDVQKAIHAARTGTISTGTSVIASRVNGKVGAAGGSAGGSHALWCSILGTPGDTKLDAAVMLSGIYEFDDSGSLMDSHFASIVDLYCRTSSSDANRTAHLQAGSPIYAITPTTVLPPLYFFGRADDPATPQQLEDLKNRLTSYGFSNWQSVRLPAANDMNVDHAFEYWCVSHGTTTVNAEIKTWLHSQLPN